MQSIAFALRLVLGALVSLAISVSPVFALSGMHGVDQGTSIHHDEGAPCDTPCDGCDGEAHSKRCDVACAGFAVAMLCHGSCSPLDFGAVRVVTFSSDMFVGRDDEPAKPPPKPILA